MPGAGAAAKVCGDTPRGIEVTPFAATITDLRVCNAGGDEILTAYDVEFSVREIEPRPASPYRLGHGAWSSSRG